MEFILSSANFSNQLDPYTTFANIPIMSQNGEKPVYYKGWHQADVVRIKAYVILLHYYSPSTYDNATSQYHTKLTCV